MLIVDDVAMANEPLRTWAMHVYTKVGRFVYVMEEEWGKWVHLQWKLDWSSW